MREKPMLGKKSLFVPTALVFMCLFGVSVANAQNPNPNPNQQCYTLASLQGNYSVITTYGGNVALALGPGYFDGSGNLARTTIINEPTAGSTTGARTLVTAKNVGTYTVNCNGTGQFIRVLTANGVLTNLVDDFIITTAIVQGGQLIATTIVDAQETPAAVVPGGIFVTRVHTRLPSPPS
jgi:hypothetical protein